MLVIIRGLHQKHSGVHIAVPCYEEPMVLQVMDIVPKKKQIKLFIKKSYPVELQCKCPVEDHNNYAYAELTVSPPHKVLEESCLYIRPECMDQSLRVLAAGLTYRNFVKLSFSGSMDFNIIRSEMYQHHGKDHHERPV